MIFLVPIEEKLLPYKTIKRRVEREQEAIPERETGLKERLYTAAANIPTYFSNAFYTTLGPVISAKQNYSTRRHFKKEPDSKDNIVYLGSGWMQNRGSQAKYARKLKERGLKPYHVSVDADKQIGEAADYVFKQIKDFHDYTKLKDPKNRRDIYSGHSTGADVGIHMASDNRIRNTGIKVVQARAPLPHGFGNRTLTQKLLKYFIPLPNDNPETSPDARKRMADAYTRKPHIAVHVLAGENDRACPPKDTYYRHAASHTVLKGTHTTHFATSGSGPDSTNKAMADHLENIVNDDEWKSPAQTAVKRRNDTLTRIGTYKPHTKPKKHEHDGHGHKAH